MLAEFATRLAVALPLVCLAAVALLLAVRRGWLALPGVAFKGTAARPEARVDATGAPPLSIASVKSLSPTARIAVVHFRGRELLVGVSAQAVTLLASSDAALRAPETEVQP